MGHPDVLDSGLRFDGTGTDHCNQTRLAENAEMLRLRARMRRLLFELRMYPQVALSRSSGIWPKVLIACGVAYLVGRIDLYPHPILGLQHADETVFLLGSLFMARLLAPSCRLPASLEPGILERLQFRLRILHADLGNFFLLQHRDQSGFMISGKNSGSHWLKFMLNNAFATAFDVPPPPRSTGPSADYLVGGPGKRKPRPYPHLPHYATSHTIPSLFFAWRHAFRVVPRRPIVVLVRDIGDALCSNYLKWRDLYGTTMEEFIKGDPTGRRYVADVWWYMHFFNRWGDVMEAHPGLVLLVRYEDLKAEPGPWLRKIAAHLGVALTDEALASGLAFYDRESIRSRQDAAYGEEVVPDAAARARVSLAPREQRLLNTLLAANLRHDLGYGCPTRANSPVEPAQPAPRPT